MTRSYGIRAVLFTLLVVGGLLTSACKTLIPYQPQSAAVENPEDQLRLLINAGLNPPPLIEVTDKYLKTSTPYATQYAGGVVSKVLLFANVASFELYQIRSYYRVLVFDTIGKEVFVYQSSRLSDAQQFIDLIEMMRRRQSRTEG